MEEAGKSQSKNKKGGLKAKAQKMKAGILKSYYGNPMKDMKLSSKFLVHDDGSTKYVVSTGNTDFSPWKSRCSIPVW